MEKERREKCDGEYELSKMVKLLSSAPQTAGEKKRDNYRADSESKGKRVGGRNEGEKERVSNQHCQDLHG